MDLVIGERHFRLSELSKLWGYSTDALRSWFRDVPGVLVVSRPEKMNKRGYRSIRIPESVARLIYDKHLSGRGR